MEMGSWVKECGYELGLDDAWKVVEEMKKAGRKVSHIITDPPYNISQKNNIYNMTDGTRFGLDFGEWDHGFDLMGWVKPWADVLDKNGSMIVFCSYRNISDYYREMTRCGLDVKDVIVWQKINPMPRNTERRYVQDMEFALWAVKHGANWVFHKQEGVPYMRALYKHHHVNGKEKTIHPTQKKIGLMEDLVKVHTNAGDTIADPFMGSGTTGVAALLHGRRFIGVDNNETYFEVARDRIRGCAEEMIKTD